MSVWFTVIAVLGVRAIVTHPVILEALSPSYAIGFLSGHFGTAFFSLTAVVLAVTGAEALYADMGHFGRTPVRRAWLLVVFPACILNYLGQGALILGHPASISNLFFLLAPGWASSRWCSSPPWRPSSPRRRSSAAPSRSRTRPGGSATCRGCASSTPRSR